MGKPIDEVYVSPDMQFYNLLESFPYTPESAISEYIDNALQAFLDKRNLFPQSHKLKIELHFNCAKENRNIIIRDNGVGIAEDELQRALKPAYQPQKTSLSEFGIGMKAASTWFSRNWRLESFPINTNKGFAINFNLDKLLTSNSDRVKVDTLSTVDIPGVCISLLDVKIPFTYETVQETWKKLQEIYQIFIFRDTPILEISAYFSGTILPKNDDLQNYVPTILNYPKFETFKNQSYSYGKHRLWKQDVDFKFNDKDVKGYLCILETSSQTSNPGLRLFRFNRLIKGFGDQHYRPISLLGTANKHAPSRVYGELHLDGQKISNHKGDFLFDEIHFLDTLKNQPGINELIEQAEKYRANDVKDEKVTHFKSEEDFFATTKKKRKKTEGKDNSNKGKNQKSKNNTDFNPIDILRNIQINSNDYIINEVRKELIHLFESYSWFSFCLCFRVLLELGILSKLKRDHSSNYQQACGKSIIALTTYLSGNLGLIDDKKHVSLHRMLKGHNVDDFLPFMDLTNIASHGHAMPSQETVKTLLINSKDFLEWIFE